MPNARRPLTRRQREIYAFIATRIRTLGYAPSYEEIAREFELRSLATVHEHLRNLEQRGYIRRSFHQSRAIELTATNGRCPHCGAIQQPEKDAKSCP